MLRAVPDADHSPPDADPSPPDADPSPHADVRDAAHAYEAALVTGDVAAATAWFSTDPGVSRFGPDGLQVGPAEVAAARAAQSAQPEPVWLVDDVRSLGDDIALHLAVLDRDGVTIQRTQVWQRGHDGWRIAHAHVTRLPTTTTQPMRSGVRADLAGEHPR
jgi:hypothetical protein